MLTGSESVILKNLNNLNVVKKFVDKTNEYCNAIPNLIKKKTPKSSDNNNNKKGEAHGSPHNNNILENGNDF